MSKRWNPEDEQYLIANCQSMSRSELADHFKVTVKSISDKLRRLTKKGDVKTLKPGAKTPDDDPLLVFGESTKAFIWDFIRHVDYTDIARLAGIKPEDLKAAVEKTGIKLPLERARPWNEIDVGKFQSLQECARCQVQISHPSFLVGVKNCRKCLEKNLKHWLKNDIKVILKFKDLS